MSKKRNKHKTHKKQSVKPKPSTKKATAPNAPDKGEMTLNEFAQLYLERYGREVRPRTVQCVRKRFHYAEREFGPIPLAELQSMVEEIAAWRTLQADAYGRVRVLHQVLAAAVRWGYMTSNPVAALGRTPLPRPRPIRVYSAAELDAIAAQLIPLYAPLPTFVCATGLRPAEWAALRVEDVDREAGILHVRRTLTVLACDRDDCPPDCEGHHGVGELGKTHGSLRRVPLSPIAAGALDQRPQSDTPWQWPSTSGELLNLDVFRIHHWRRAVRAAAIPLPARIYDMRSTFATRALAAGVPIFDLAHIMGTSVRMIERHYGASLPGSLTNASARLADYEAAEQAGERAIAERSSDAAAKTSGEVRGQLYSLANFARRPRRSGSHG